MYAYFIDAFVYEKHKKKLDRLDLEITQKGISGKKIKLGRLHNLESSIKECIGQGVKTFVAVGSDDTASRVLNTILKTGVFSFSFSFISMQDNSRIGDLIGYCSISEAIDALSAHRTAKIDVGLLNKRHYFLTAAVFYGKCALGFSSYTVSSLLQKHHISVCSSDIYSNTLINQSKFNVADGIFEAVIARETDVSFLGRLSSRGKKFNNYIPESVFSVQSILIKSKQKTVSVFADTEKQFSAPILVEVMPKFLNVVVGKKFYE